MHAYFNNAYSVHVHVHVCVNFVCLIFIARPES